MTPRELAWLRLHLTKGLGRKGLFRLLQAFGTPEQALAVPASEWKSRSSLRNDLSGAVLAADAQVLRAAEQCLASRGVKIVSWWDEADYPPLLRTLPDPPALLYICGTLPKEDLFAVVGARRASEAGSRLTRQICQDLVAHRITIVSGLARGIDTAAHEGALAGRGKTVAVLGCGIDCIYPPENARLFERITRQGAVISEYPPGTPPLAGHFPGRNRIISGLSRGVLVVEAAAGSGSLITADFALEQGREVFAVPGAVHLKSSQGSNRLLKDGAQLVTEAADILSALWPSRPCIKERLAEEGLLAELSVEQRQVYLSLGEEPLHIDELAGKSGLTPMELSAILLHLELRGGVKQLPGKRFLRQRPV